MVRLWLALVVVGVLGGTAHAIKAHETCTCGEEIVTLPRDGAVDVPTNTRIWRLYRDKAPTTIGVVPALEPYTVKELSAYQLTFTTGAGPDLEPPVEPRIAYVTIEVTDGSMFDRMDVASMHVVGAISADAAILRVKLFDGGKVITYYMDAHKRWMCEPGFRLHAGAIHGEITAIDLAGNESTPVPFDAMSQFVPSFDSPCVDAELGHADHLYVHREAASTVIAVVVLGLDLVVVLAIGVVMSRRSRKRATATAEPLAITAAEQLARRIRLRSALTAVGLVGAVAGLAPTDPRVAGILALMCPLLLCALGTTLASWWAATRLLRLAARDGAVTLVHHDLVEIALPDRGASLACPRRLIVRAQAAGLPKATSL